MILAQPFHHMVRTSNAVVDKRLALLLERLWRQGFETVASCEDFQGLRTAGQHGWAYIKFLSSDDALRFCESLDMFRRNGEFVDFPAADIEYLTAVWVDKS